MTSEKKEVFLTSEGFLEIEEELNELKTVKRPEIIKAIYQKMLIIMLLEKNKLL